MIRRCRNTDLIGIESIINEAAQAYKGHIPADCWHVPYMTFAALKNEIEAGVRFWGWEDHELLAVMGAELVQDVTLIRHAYTHPSHQGKGFGRALLEFLIGQTDRPLLVGTWAGATWAIRFYERHGFRLADASEAGKLLDRYWRVPPRQRDPQVSVVLIHKNRPLQAH